HGSLEATRVHAEEVPLAIDELTLVALLGCFAEGRTVVSGAEELRHKESDRIATVVEGLGGIGADIEATEDGFAVNGTGELAGGRLDAHRDHRLAMLGAIAGLASREGVEVAGMEAAGVSYPGFEDDLRALLYALAGVPAAPTIETTNSSLALPSAAVSPTCMRSRASPSMTAPMRTARRSLPT